MNELAIDNNINIENMIYEIRGKQVMIDSDLAKLYECKNGTKSINLAVKRNFNRFPERFMFQLTLEEFQNLKFHFETSSGNNYGGIRKLPYVFTEQGVAMLATVIKTEVAEQVSIQIMDAFVAMRKYISTNLLEQKYINNQVMKNTEDIKILQETFSKLSEKRKDHEIYFNGQIYDAYSKIYEIFNSAKTSLTIIDAYADNTILDIIKRISIPVTIITKEKMLLTKQDITRYNEQYNNLTVIFDNTFHDRYFIIDNEEIYHCGTSINRIGHKTFSITLINDDCILDMLLDKINNNSSNISC